MKKEPTLNPRVPRQARSIARANKILDTTEQLILEIGIDNISAHKIAEKAKIPSASVYQYFPRKSYIFLALSERKADECKTFFEEELNDIRVEGWEELSDLMVSLLARAHMNDPVAQALFIGIHTATVVREAAFSRINAFSNYYAGIYENHFDTSDIDNFVEKIAISTHIAESVFVRSLYDSNEIRSHYIDEAALAVREYLRIYLHDIKLSPNNSVQ